MRIEEGSKGRKTGRKARKGRGRRKEIRTPFLREELLLYITKALRWGPQGHYSRVFL